ncbi:MAG TPA: DUF459 domain-containing protein [Pseudolabrys sp.]|nr:DUF459 domain-containing protein [Pseudolabrys sp.]
MAVKNRFSRWLVGAALLAAVDIVGLAALEIAVSSPAQAQWRDDRFPFLSRQRQQRSGGGFFGGLFGGGQRSFENTEQPQAPVDNSRAPPPKKVEAKPDAPAPTTSIVVMGDGMADWLAYGLEEAFADTPEVAIVRKNKIHSGLLRYESKGDLDWWHVARDILSQEKANYVVMMLGISDRQNIRERDLAKEADKKKEKDKANKPAPDKDIQNKDAQNKDPVEDPEQDSIAAPETQPGKKATGIIEFRTDQWAEIYSKRIDETIAALKSKGVPVFWVGLPSIRGTKSTADAVYLNDLYRARAERAGVVYVDIWDGFVDESGKYSNFGPDYEGQIRRLRSNDGVFFTKSGALKLAHYVEREIRRQMNSRVAPIALPSGPVTPATPDGKPAARPMAGPVIPLTVTPTTSEELLGGAGNSSPHGDAIATRVLVKGEPVAAPRGRADDFVLKPDNEGKPTPPAAAMTPAAAMAAAPAETARPEPAPEKKTTAPKASPPKAAQNTQTQAKPKPARPQQRDEAPRPPRPVGLFGTFR